MRIGSMEYEPTPIVKRHTLDTRYTETMNCQLQRDVKMKLALAEELIDVLKRGHFLN